MQMIRPPTPEAFARVGWGVCVLLVTGVAGGGICGQRLTALGAKVRLSGALCDTLTLTGDGLRGVDLVVVDCDHAGGFAAGQRVQTRLCAAGARIPVVLIWSACREQVFHLGWQKATHLRAPVSALAMRIAFEQIFAPPALPDPGGLNAYGL